VDPELVLTGLFLHLRQGGMPLGPRDFLDALRALRQGFGLHGRDRLLWLCQTLWARSEEEVRQIGLLFANLPQPTSRDVETVRKVLLGVEQKGAMGPEEDPGPEGASEAKSFSPSPSGPTAAVHFATAGQPGLPLMRPRIEPHASEPFVLNPRPLIALRSLITAWRRFRVPLRTGARTELDIPATIADQSRRGRSAAPVRIAPRRNLARLTVLADMSPSMLPWRSFAELLRQSLAQSQLGEAALYYFANLPEDSLYRTPSLTRPLSLIEVEDRHRGTPMLIFGDGGAARGYRNRDRVSDTRALLARWSRLWRPIVWINPMPRNRWNGTSFEAAVGAPGVTTMQLGDAELIHAIDVMRGRRTG
jgi:uncharacterized protein with von Willebrand factor type A (vWA) domain